MKFHSLRALTMAMLGLIAAQITTLAPLASVPAPWSSRDIGAVGVPGSAAHNAGTWAVYGSGVDIWDRADGFHFVHQRLNGNAQVVARVMGVAATHGWAKAGLMIREDLTPGSRHAFVCLTPNNGVAFQSRSASGGVSLNANTAPLGGSRWVKLARHGDQFTAWQSADGKSWALVGTTVLIDMPPVVHVGLAATSHDNARLGNTGFQDVQLLPLSALLVAGSANLNAGDAAAKKRLEILGYAVTVKAALSASAADAKDRDLVVISSTVWSPDVGAKFSGVNAPVITWENALLDDMGMTGTTVGVDFGTTGPRLGLGIFPSACERATMYIASSGWGDGCQDMAAGLTGTFDATRSNQPVSWGRPNAAAIRIAHPYGNDALSAVFAYEKDVAMPGRKAPARRVFLYLGDNTAATWTGRGQSLFDAAVRWAGRTRYAITKDVLVINFDPILESQGGLRMHDWGQRRTGSWGGDPWPLVRDYLADLTEASGGYVRWRRVLHPSVPDYIDRWPPLRGAVQFDSPEFPEQAFVDAYEYALTSGDWVGATRMMPGGGDYRMDYHRILDEYGVDALVNAGEVDEVIVATPPYAGAFESVMAGPTAYAVNGDAFPRTTVRNFLVMNLSYERGLSEVLENFGHRAEWMLSRAFHGYPNTISYDGCFYPDWNRDNQDPPPCGGSRQVPLLRNLYDRFVTVEGILPGEAAVGSVHWAPNATSRSDEYVWNKDLPVYSLSDDWLFNYPAMEGASTKRPVNVYDWLPMAQNDDAGRGFKKWWLFHMPRVPGVQPASNPHDSFKLNNWWEYMINHNAHPETER